MDKAIAKLLAWGSIGCVSNRPRGVNALNLVRLRGKKRLILDLPLVNQHLHLDGTRLLFEDIKDLSSVLYNDDILFKVVANRDTYANS